MATKTNRMILGEVMRVPYGLERLAMFLQAHRGNSDSGLEAVAVPLGSGETALDSVSVAAGSIVGDDARLEAVRVHSLRKQPLRFLRLRREVLVEHGGVALERVGAVDVAFVVEDRVERDERLAEALEALQARIEPAEILISDEGESLPADLIGGAAVARRQAWTFGRTAAIESLTRAPWEVTPSMPQWTPNLSRPCQKT